jgi:fumarylacetoacetase
MLRRRRRAETLDLPNIALDASHDASRRSWVASANKAGTDFPIQNLPFGIFREAGNGGPPRGGVAIGDHILDVSAVVPLLGNAQALGRLLGEPTLQPLMSLSPSAWTALRLGISDLLVAGHNQQRRIERHLHPMASTEMFLPVRPGGFVDFFASIQHATNAGSIFRPDAPLLPNYKYVPIGYNGRTSTIGISGAVRRPCGQTRAGQDMPSFGPSRRFDFEAELGVFLGGNSVQGYRCPWRKLGVTSSASAYSTIGRPAIFRPGNISRSARSSARVLRPLSRLGW